MSCAQLNYLSVSICFANVGPRLFPFCCVCLCVQKYACTCTLCTRWLEGVCLCMYTSVRTLRSAIYNTRGSVFEDHTYPLEHVSTTCRLIYQTIIKNEHEKINKPSHLLPSTLSRSRTLIKLIFASILIDCVWILIIYPFSKRWLEGLTMLY